VKNKFKTKGLGRCGSSGNACLASMRPYVQFPVLTKISKYKRMIWPVEAP
jgi:hypothetical protein